MLETWEAGNDKGKEAKSEEVQKWAAAISEVRSAAFQMKNKRSRQRRH